jgi:signal transduction histidine kinase
MASESLTLFVLDDDEEDVELIRRAAEGITEWSTRVAAFHDWGAGREALRGSAFDVLVLDYVLGDRTGLEVVEEIRMSGDDRPIVVLTGKGDERAAAGVSRAGADDYLAKWDLSPESLQSAIGAARDRCQARREEAIVAEQIQLGQRLQSVSTLVGGIAHDFNNILAVMVGYLELALDRVSDPEARRHLDEVERSCEQMADLIRRLRSLNASEVVDPAPLDVGHLLRELGALLHRVLPPAIELLIREPEGSLTLVASSAALRQVVMVLATNAAEAMPEGGVLTIGAESVQIDEAGARACPGLRRGPHVLLTVRDTGHGMDAETQARAFEPFYTTRGLSSRKGKGLGLAAAWHAVRSHGGYIAIDSQPGQGATFRVYFPLVPTGPVAQRQTEAAEAPAPH